MVRAARRRSVRLTLVVALAAVWAGAAPVTAAPGFDSGRAWNLIRLQLSYGQRPAGSPQLRKLADRLRPLLPNGRFEPLPGQPGLRNIVGTLPGTRPGIVIGAHYDTLADPKGFVGANNGAAGTAIVVEAARVLAQMPRPAGAREIRFVLFDGEEPAHGLPEDSNDFYDTGLRGSRAYVRAYPRRTAAMVLLDYVGNKGLQLPREQNSSAGLWHRLRRAAAQVGASSVFPPVTGPGYIDDHWPFLKTGVPAIDLIDPNYQGHDVGDTLDKLSRRSVDLVGKTVVALAASLR